MAQGEFTKGEAREIKVAVEEVFNAVPKTRRLQFIGHMNDIYLFLAAAERAAPETAPAKKE